MYFYIINIFRKQGVNLQLWLDVIYQSIDLLKIRMIFSFLWLQWIQQILYLDNKPTNISLQPFRDWFWITIDCRLPFLCHQLQTFFPFCSVHPLLNFHPRMRFTYNKIKYLYDHFSLSFYFFLPFDSHFSQLISSWFRNFSQKHALSL